MSTVPRRLRRSMTARITLSIVLVALLLVGASGVLLERLVARELRDQNELALLDNVDILRADLAEAGGDPALLRRLLDRDERRTRVRIRVADAAGRELARSARFDLPSPQAAPVFDATLLPASPDLPTLRAVRAAHPGLTTIASGADGGGLRVLRATVASPAGGPALQATLAIATAKTREVREREVERLLAALVVAAAIAAALGVAIARGALADARRLGAAAERIGANALGERLRLDDVPIELEASARAFNRMLERLEAAFDRLARFSAEVAHDLRTPIGNLLGEAQVALSRARTAEEYRTVLESAVEEYERMSRMISNMLFLARADNDQAAIERRTLRLDDLLERVVAYFELLADERVIILRARVEAAPGREATVHADDSLVTRALGNLIANAIRHAADGSVVEVAAHVAADGACAIAVSNQGPAIPPEHLERVFERFYRVERSREVSSAGSGLGLAIVRSVMALHGGSADVRCADGRTVFTLRFPVGEA